MSISLKPSLGTKGASLTAVALAAALSLTGCGNAAPSGHADQLAVAVVDHLASSDVAGATTDFSPAMAKMLPAADLTQKWKHYQQVLGDYRAHGQPQAVAQGPLTVVNVPLSMAQKPGQLRVTVDQTGHVAGLFLLG